MFQTNAGSSGLRDAFSELKCMNKTICHALPVCISTGCHKTGSLARVTSQGTRGGRSWSITQMKVHEAASLRGRGRLRLPPIGCMVRQEARCIPDGGVADDALARPDYLRPALLDCLPVLWPQLDACCLAPCMPPRPCSHPQTWLSFR